MRLGMFDSLHAFELIQRTMIWVQSLRDLLTLELSYTCGWRVHDGQFVLYTMLTNDSVWVLCCFYCWVWVGVIYEWHGFTAHAIFITEAFVFKCIMHEAVRAPSGTTWGDVLLHAFAKKPHSNVLNRILPTFHPESEREKVIYSESRLSEAHHQAGKRAALSLSFS